MRSLRWILGAVAVVVVLIGLAIAAGVAWLNTYIHSDAFKQDVEAKAGQSIGGVVQIQTIDFDIFNGVKLQGLVTQLDPKHAGGQGAVLVKVASVNCAYSWTQLLSRELKLTGITLDKPEIVLTKEPTAPMTPTEAPAESANTQGSSTGTSGEGSSMPFKFILDRARINDGIITVKDAAGATLIDLQDFDAQADTSGYYDGKDVTGTVKIADVTLPSNMHLKSFYTPFTYRPGQISCNPFSAVAYNGSLAGDYALGTSGPSILNLNAKGLDASQITEATNSGSSAKLSGTLDLQSKWRGIETGDVNGEGDAQLTNGKLEGVKILNEIGQALKVKELNDPAISKAQTHFLIQNRQTRLTTMQINSTIFQITGGGTIDFDGPLNMNLVLILTRDAMSKLPKELAASFVQKQDGTGSIAFTVTGTTSNPQTDLPERLLMQNTQIKKVVNKFLNNFFH